MLFTHYLLLDDLNVDYSIDLIHITCRTVIGRVCFCVFRCLDNLCKRNELKSIWRQRNTLKPYLILIVILPFGEWKFTNKSYSNEVAVPFHSIRQTIFEMLLALPVNVIHCFRHKTCIFNKIAIDDNRPAK